jgi:hypothetical protein
VPGLFHRRAQVPGAVGGVAVNLGRLVLGCEQRRGDRGVAVFFPRTVEGTSCIEELRDQLARKDFVHDLGAGGDHWAQFAAVHDLRGAGAGVPGQAAISSTGTPELDMRLTNEVLSSRGAHCPPSPAAFVIFLNARRTFAASSGDPIDVQNTSPRSCHTSPASSRCSACRT